MKKGFTGLFFIMLLLPSFLAAQDSLFTNFAGIEFVRIPPGSFVVGKFHPPYPLPENYKGKAENKYKEKEYKKARKLAMEDTRNGFTVAIPHAFFIGKYEVTQE